MIVSDKPSIFKLYQQSCLMASSHLWVNHSLEWTPEPPNTEIIRVQQTFDKCWWWWITPWQDYTCGNISLPQTSGSRIWVVANQRSYWTLTKWVGCTWYCWLSIANCLSTGGVQSIQKQLSTRQSESFSSWPGESSAFASTSCCSTSGWWGEAG